jgi:hypothetical protein
MIAIPERNRFASGFTFAHPREAVRHGRAAAPERVPLAQPHLRAGHRRRQGRHHRLGLDTGKKNEDSHGGNVAAAKEVGKLVAERRSRRASRRWSSIAAAISITVASRPWPMPRAKLVWTSKF